MKATIGAVAGATAAVGAMGASAVNAGMEFDSSMSQVAATMGKTMDELEKETGRVGDFEGNLRDYAQYMGSTTAFSASQAADALNYMALAGYDTQKSMEMLPGVLNLAAAGGMELAQASDMVTDTQSALGLSTEETEKLIDKMAKTASKSNTSVSQLGDALLTVGGTGKMVKGGTTELSTALGILADNGVKGAEGGTALRNILLSLSAPTDKAAKKMKELGLEAFDSEGNLRPLNETFEDLNGILGKMTQQEQTEVLNDLFNKVDLKSVNALLANSGERFTDLSAAIDEAQGAAEDMAETQLDNLAGDITLFQSALEGAKIAASDELTPALREIVQFGTEGLSQLTQSFKDGGIDAMMETLGQLLTDGLNKLIDKLPGMVNAGITLLNALIDGIIQNLPTLIEAGTQILQAIVQAVMENIPKLMEAAKTLLVTFGQAIVEYLPEMASSGQTMILQFLLGMAQKIPDLMAMAVDIILSMINGLLDNLGLIVAIGLQIITSLIEGIIYAIPDLILEVPVIISKLVEAITELLPTIIACGVQLIIALIGGIISAIPSIIAAIPEILVAITAGLANGFHDVFEVGGDLMEGLWQGIKASAGRLIENVKGIAKNIIKSFKGVLGINSPSKEFAWMGDMCVAGFDESMEDLNIDDTTANIEASISSMKAGVQGAQIEAMSGSGGNLDSNVNVYLEGDAAGVFRLVRTELDNFMKSSGWNPLAQM